MSSSCYPVASPRTRRAFGVAVVAAAVLAGTTSTAQRGGGAAAGVRDVTVSAIPGVVAAGSTWARAWQGTDNADGLVAAADGGLLFAQEQPSRVSKLDQNDRVSVVVDGTRGAGSLAIDTRGRLLAVLRTCTDPGGTPEQCKEPTAIAELSPNRVTLASSFEGRPLGRLNDLVAHTSGGVFFTVGGAFFMNPQGVVSSLGSDIRANGIMLSPDERTLYVTHGAGGTGGTGGVVLAFDVALDGATSRRREFARLEAGGNGDGMAVDAIGRLYVTSQPGVQVFAAEGTYLGLIPTPRNAISVAFAGRDKRTLYIVGSGALAANGQEFTTPPGVRNNAKTIYRLPTLARGFAGRAK
jgi:gluconolactonase